VFVPA